jgi:hypothetical protein
VDSTYSFCNSAIFVGSSSETVTISSSPILEPLPVDTIRFSVEPFLSKSSEAERFATIGFSVKTIMFSVEPFLPSNEFTTCISRILNQLLFNGSLFFIIRGLQSVFFCYSNSYIVTFDLNRKLRSYRKT